MTQKVPEELLEDGAVLSSLTAGVSLVAGNYLRVAVGGGEMEQRTPAEVRADIGAGTGSGSVTSVNVTGSTGLTPSGGPITSSGSITLTLDTGLQALASFNTNGFVAQTSQNVWAGRTLTGVTNRTTITNGDGVSGNPTFDISASYVGQATITTLGTITTGTWQGTAIAVSFGGTGTTAPTGTYTPTFTNVANVSANTPQVARWMRLQNTIHVSGMINITPTATGNTIFRLSLPVASALTANHQIVGAGYNLESSPTAIAIYCDAGSDTAEIQFNAGTTSLRAVGFNFTYPVQ